jgi:hypothetical protein
MTLSDIASIGSLVSGVAVLISLIYLSIQVKQAERNQRALMQQGRADRVSDNSLRMADPELSDIFRRGRSGDEGLDPAELHQFAMLCRCGFVSGEDSFLQHLSGQLDDAAYHSYVAGVRSMLTSPGLRAMWRMSSQDYGDEYRKFMDKILRETQAAPESNRLARWVETVRAEKEGVPIAQ